MNKTIFAIFFSAGLTACSPVPLTVEDVYTAKIRVSSLDHPINWECSGPNPFEPRCDDPVQPVQAPVEPPVVLPVVPGNPGNDKPVGGAGEHVDKGMAEGGEEGNRGGSN